MDNTHEWCAKGVSPQMRNLKNLTSEMFPWGMKAFRKRKVVRINDVSKMPAQAKAEKEILESQDIKSLIVFPVNVEEEIAGCIGFDNIREAGGWTDDDLAILRMSSEIIGTALERKRAERVLREREEKYRSVFENTGTATALIAEDTTITMANTELERLSGYSREQLEGKMRWTDFVVKEDLERMKRYHYERREPGGKAPTEYEFGFVDKQGNTKNISLKIGIIPGTKTSVASLMDITSHKRAKEALKNSEEKYRDLVENVAEVIYAVDNNGVLTYVSPSVESIAGYRPSELIGGSFDKVIHAEELPRVMRNFRRTVSGHHQSHLYRFLTKSGKLFWGRTSSRPTYVGNRITGLQGVITDVTEREQAREALVRAKDNWENTFNSINDMVMLLDNEHRIVHVNRATTEGFNTTKESLVGKKCYEAVHGQRHPIKECPLIITTRTLKPSTREIAIARIGRTCICSTSPIFDGEGKLTGYTHSLKDLTEWKHLEAQLQQAQKMEAIGTLAGGIAHDFNNLLMGIQGNVSLVLMDMDLTHPYYERLKNIEKQVQSGARLTSHLLGYARKGRYEVSPINLNQLVEEAAYNFGRARKEITIHLDLAEDLYAIEADPGQIEQVLLNLGVNAADAMPAGGDLTLKTANVTHKDMKGQLYEPKPGNYVLLAITDTGAGMDKKTMQRIFEPFFTTKELGHGTGLGLASVYGIMKGHGGYIDVESKKEQGTTFSIYLPASEKEIREIVKTADEIIKGTETVLLVDDEEAVLEVGKALLEAMGYRVLIAKDGKEAVQVYKKNRNEIDIVILDMVMPKMGGGEAYDRMKEIDPDIKVLLSSGFSIDGEAGEILERGCNGFIQKPFNMRELSGKIRGILDKK